jgi:hypothetical protein
MPAREILLLGNMSSGEFCKAQMRDLTDTCY